MATSNRICHENTSQLIKNCVFSEVSWKNPRNEICLWYWFAGQLQSILGETIRYNMKYLTWNKCFGLFHCQVCDKEFWRATKSFDTILFVSSCLSSEIPVTIKGRISYHNESNQKSWLHTFLSSHVLMKTHCEPKIMLMFVSSCLQISEIPVTIKGRISYHNESN